MDWDEKFVIEGIKAMFAKTDETETRNVWRTTFIYTSDSILERNDRNDIVSPSHVRLDFSSVVFICFVEM